MDANGPLHSEVITALRSVTVSCQATQTLAPSEATLKGADLTDPSCEDAFAAEATPTRKQAVLKKKRKKPPVQRKGAQDEVCVLEHQQATKLPSQLLDTQISNLLDVDGRAELDSTPVRSSTSSPASPKKVRMDAGYHSSLDGSQEAAPVAEAAKQEKHAKEKTVEETEVSLRHGKFITEGSVQDFVYIPARSTMDLAAKSSELFDTILRHWNLQRPYLLIKFQSGFAHPKHLLDAEELRKLENKHMDSEIYKYYMHFRNFVSYQEKVNAEEEGQDLDREKREQIIRERTLELLNEFLYKSLSNLIDVIVRACVRNRCWILVEGGPNGGLLLLKQAAERCNERPTVLVLDSLKKKRYPYREVKTFIEEEKELQSKLKVQTLEQLALRGAKPDEVHEIAERMALQKLKEREDDKHGGRVPAARRSSIKSKKSEHSGAEQKSKDLPPWELDDQIKVEEIKVQSAIMTALVLENARPINQPIVDTLRLCKDFQFWNPKLEEEGWACKSHKDRDAGKVRWNNWHFRGGTHYIFTDEGYKDLVLHCLAPSGCIFLGGGDSCKKELLKMLVNGQPVVCLSNTGRLTQDFVRCHEFLCSRLFRLAKIEEDGAKSIHRQTTDTVRDVVPKLQRSNRSSLDLPKQEKEDYLRDKIARRTLFTSLTFDGHHGVDERTNLVDTMMKALEEVTTFTQPEICELLLTYLRRGLQITKLCVVMDPLNPRECSGGHTEDKLSMCLSNFVILASNDTSDFADVEAVKAASELEMLLLGAAKVEHRWAVLMIYMLVVLNLLSLLLALVRSGGAAATYAAWLPEGLQRWGLPAVSALSTFISGLVARFRFTLRWSKAQSAAAHLEAEIWKFRTRVSDYTVVGSSGSGADAEEEGIRSKAEIGQVFTRERKQDETRNLFRGNVTNIFNSAMEEMGTSSLHNGGRDKLPKPHEPMTARGNPFGTCPWCRCCLRRQPENYVDVDDRSPTGSKAPEREDLSSYGHLGIDEYYDQRTLEVLARMKKQAFWLTFKQGALESFVLLFGTAGVLLSTFDQTELAMVCVSLAASLQSLERFHALSTRLDAANAGERDMICAWQDWSAMEPMQRRFQSNVSRLVLTTEGVNVALTSAATAGVRQSLAKKPS